MILMSMPVEKRREGRAASAEGVARRAGCVRSKLAREPLGVIRRAVGLAGHEAIALVAGAHE